MNQQRLVLTVSEAAIMLGCSDKEIRRRMRDGILKEVATKTRKRVMVSLVSVLEALGTSEATISEVVQQRLDQLGDSDSRSSESTCDSEVSAPQRQAHQIESDASLLRRAASGKRKSREARQNSRRDETSRGASPAYLDRSTAAALRRCFAPAPEGKK